MPQPVRRRPLEGHGQPHDSLFVFFLPASPGIVLCVCRRQFPAARNRALVLILKRVLALILKPVLARGRRLGLAWSHVVLARRFASARSRGSRSAARPHPKPRFNLLACHPHLSRAIHRPHPRHGSVAGVSRLHPARIPGACPTCMIPADRARGRTTAAGLDTARAPDHPTRMNGRAVPVADRRPRPMPAQFGSGSVPPWPVPAGFRRGWPCRCQRSSPFAASRSRRRRGSPSAGAGAFRPGDRRPRSLYDAGVSSRGSCGAPSSARVRRVPFSWRVAWQPEQRVTRFSATFFPPDSRGTR